MNKNLTINMGNCHHRKYIPRLIEMIQARRIDPAKVLTQVKPMTDAIAAFEAFDRRENGWIKVELQPQASSRGEAAGSGQGEEKLDEAIEQTFPASDPTAPQNPR
ncbi:Glutathione-dependent formaldehyde dehydrogenase OS=Stutzerimonas stutzeri OX=316 GN=CXK95_09725 PE=3 SV=1 [Stutzerimonas stutzeri]